MKRLENQSIFRRRRGRQALDSAESRVQNQFSANVARRCALEQAKEVNS